MDLVDDDIDIAIGGAEEIAIDLGAELSARLARFSRAWRGCFLQEDSFLWCLRVVDGGRFNLDVSLAAPAIPLGECVLLSKHGTVKPVPCPRDPAGHLRDIYNTTACFALPRVAWRPGWSRDMRDGRNRALAAGVTPRDAAAIAKSSAALAALGYVSFLPSDFDACSSA